MNQKLKALLAAMALAACAAPSYAADVGVSINIGQPGFYGQIDIGDFPRPRVIYEQPVIIERHRVVEQAVYIRVPPGHRKDWKRYCGRYSACGRPVYFVQDDWYNNDYAPRYRERHGDRDDHRDHGNRGHDDHGHDDHGGHGKGKGKDKDRH